MSALVRAELLKLRSTRTTLWLLLASLALLAMAVSVSVPKIGDDRAPVPLGDPDLLSDAVGNAFGVPMVLVVLLGGIAFTQEFRYGTITATYLGEPRRIRVLVAKLVTMALASLAVATLALVVAATFGIALIGSRDGRVSLGTRFWEMAAAGFVVVAMYAVVGVAIGSLVRNQIIAVAGVLVWMLAVEQIVVTAHPVVGRWMPYGATLSLMQLDRSVGLEGELLSMPAAGVVLAAYTAAAVVLALRLTPKKDVL